MPLVHDAQPNVRLAFPSNRVDVTLVAAAYNSIAFLDDFFASVQRQTYQGFRLVFVDDGSTDESGALCDEYQKKDSRITVIHKTNGGAVHSAVQNALFTPNQR